MLKDRWCFLVYSRGGVERGPDGQRGGQTCEKKKFGQGVLY